MVDSDINHYFSQPIQRLQLPYLFNYCIQLMFNRQNAVLSDIFLNKDIFLIILLYMKHKTYSKSKIDHPEHARANKSEINHQQLLLEMMAKFYNQQKIFVEEQRITNRLLKKIAGEDQFQETIKESISSFQFTRYKKDRVINSSRIQKSIPQRMITTRQNYGQKHLNFDECLDFQDLNNYTEKSKNSKSKSPGKIKNQIQLIKKQSNQKICQELQKIATILLKVENNQQKRQQNIEKMLQLTINSSIKTKQSIKQPKIEENIFSMLFQGEVPVQRTKQSQKIDSALVSFVKDRFLNQSESQKKNIMEHKKNYHVLSQIRPYSDRRELKIKIPIEEILQNSPEKVDLKDSIEEWLGIVYRATASICWHMLSNYLLNFEEVKILFTENIVYNFIDCMQTLKERGYQNQRDQMAQVINKTSIKILNFLCKQYPLTKIDTPNLALRERIQLINDKGNAEFDLIGQLSVYDESISFALRQDRNYTSLIMKCINHMIIRTKKQYKHFERTMTSQFQEIFYKTKRQRKQEEEGQNKQFSTTEEQKYYQQVKSYTKILIGCKINKNTELYSDHQIENQVFYVKSMSILRIITKWLEAVQEMYENPKKQIKQSSNQFKDHKGNYLYLYQQVKNQLYKKVKENRKFLEQKLDSIKKQCYKMEVLLSERQFTTDSSHYHLSVEQTSVGRYCTNLKSAISSYICSELSEVIHFLLEIPTKINLQKLGLDDKRDQKQVKDDIKRLNLVQLKLFDLLRCKCISKQSEIIYLLDRIYEKHNDINDQFRIVRIKDRLNTTTRDILLNVQLQKKGLVCEIQLAVVGNIDKKQQLLDSYSHFLYELERAQLGPLSENACIWGALDQKAIFFQNLKKSEDKEVKIRKTHDCVKKYEMEEHTNLSKYFQNFFRPLICESCSSFFQIPRTCLQNVVCKMCRKTFCGECQLESLSSVSDIMRKKFIFESNKFNYFLKYLTEYTDFEKPFPKKGFIIKKHYLKKQLSFYKIIEKEIDQNQKENQNQDDTEKRFRLEMTNTVLEKKKIISKILNKEPIIAIQRNEHFYIEPSVSENDVKKERQIQTFFIYTFDENKNDKIKLARGQWAEIIEKCQHNMKVMNLIHAPNYVSDLKFVKMTLKEIEKINKENDNRFAEQQISYILSGARLTLIQITTDQTKMRSGLQKKKNICKILEMIKKKNVFIDMEFSGLTDELNEIKLQLEVKKEHFLKQFCEQIQKLNLNFCFVTDIKFVRSMASLSILTLKRNLLSSIEGVEGLINLTSIRFSDNNVSSLEPLRNLIKLKDIIATRNQLTAMNGIQNLINLQNLNIGDNQITKIQHLSKINLQTLQLTGNAKIQMLQGISHMNKMVKIACGLTKINQFGELNKLDEGSIISMEVLEFQYLDLQIIPAAINNFSNLLEIDLSNCQLKSLDNLSNLKRLKEIDLTKNLLTSMKQLEHNIALQFIKLDDNYLTDICGVGHLTMLRKLSLKKNNLQKFTDVNKIESYISILYTPCTEELEVKKCTNQFQKIFAEWKEYRGALSASSSEENN